MGRKLRLAEQLWALRPRVIGEFRDAFTGSASFLWQAPRNIPRWINDLDSDLIGFHQAFQSDAGLIDRLVEAESFFASADAESALSEFNLCKYRWYFDGCMASYYIIRRFAAGPIVKRSRPNLASFSFAQFEPFRPSKRDWLEDARRAYVSLKITQGDYAAVLDAPGKDTFVLIDPPYIPPTSKSEDFYDCGFTIRDHFELRDRLRACPHRWMLIIGDCRLARDLYRGFRWTLHAATRVPLQYRQAAPKYELIVRNY
jgi:DNA adenine methylase